MITALDDFFTRALLVGIGLAIIAGPFGCFIVWRRLSYFGDALSHSSLLGLALAYLFHISITASVFLVCGLVALSLIGFQERQELPEDAILVFLSHGSLAFGLLIISLLETVRIDLMSLLFGDILSASRFDVAAIYCVGSVALLGLGLIWRKLFAITVDIELAEAEGINIRLISSIFTLLLSAVIALAIKLVGALLITALLIIPVAAVRGLARGPESMIIATIMIGITSVTIGLMGSLKWDTPSGPSIVVAAVVLFGFSKIFIFIGNQCRKGMIQSNDKT
ncbi:metal ABC transporter permease [Candidatus Endowatersipora endosymbiont of Watersipora subatra]|uniref:metal ABC transporter permease n=1 Tax=Candidatus Endowatersipora endosymbiont of Watersipora subatra TaxID=3077946 RepID=UPI003C79A999